MPFADLICIAVCVSAILTLRLALKEDATFIVFSTHSSSLSARNNVAQWYYNIISRIVM